MIIYKIETAKLTSLYESKKQAVSAFYQLMHYLGHHKYLKLYEINGKIQTIKITLNYDDPTHVDYRELRRKDFKQENRETHN
jgi:hypothetical protein